MRRTSLLMFCTYAVLVFSSTAQIPVLSDFKADTEGWSGVDLSPGGSYNTVLEACQIDYMTIEGNAPGCIQITDPTTNYYYYFAAPKFLGDKSEAYGLALEYDLKIMGPGSLFNSAPDVVLAGGGFVLVMNATNMPQKDQWTHFNVLLHEQAGWRKDSLAGPAPTTAEFRSALASMSALYIRGDYIDGQDSSQLDNVVLGTTTGGLTNVSIRTAVEIAWPTTSNTIYRVQWSPAVEPNSWSNLSGIIQGNGSTNSVFDQSYGVPKRFYRVLKLN